MSDDVILDKIELIVDEISQNKELKIKFYEIGSVIGAGVANGTGFQQKKGGKGGIEGVIIDIGSEVVKDIFLGKQKQNNPSPGTEQRQPSW
jgi:hypothetical protein